MVDRLLTDLVRTRAAHKREVDASLRALAEWMTEHPDATSRQIIEAEEYQRVIAAFSREIRDMSGALTESLPALVERERRATLR